jgi:myo-inositol-1(or 4)-monophosphatase
LPAGKPEPGSRAELDLLAQQLVAVVREAGALAQAAFGTSFRTWVKDKDSPVSEIDIAVNDLLQTRLGALAPDAAWLSEETEDAPARLGAAQLWIVDPIDGTRAFIAGRADWTISVALVDGVRPVLAALYAPVTEEFFLAVAGAGTTHNGVPVRASPGDAISGASMAGPKRILDRFAGSGVVAVPRVYSLALRLARVADGSLDVAFAGRDSHDWDLAAADLLVHEAGGLLTTIEGAPPAYNGATTTHGVLVAAGKARHRAVTASLREQLHLP